MHFDLDKKKARAGGATLPTILIMATIIMQIAVGSVIIAAILNNASYNRRVSAEALELARTGVNDALMYIQRNCSFTSGCTHSYTFTEGNGTIDVDITDGGGGVVTVGSSGTINDRGKKLEAVVGIDAITAEVHIQSIKEVER
jgi:hypothetical protein